MCKSEIQTPRNTLPQLTHSTSRQLMVWVPHFPESPPKNFRFWKQQALCKDLDSPMPQGTGCGTM